MPSIAGITPQTRFFVPCGILISMLVAAGCKKTEQGQSGKEDTPAPSRWASPRRDVPAAIVGSPAEDGAHPTIAHVAIHDLDLDGRLDILAADVRRHGIAWLRQGEDGSFTEQMIGDRIDGPVHVEPLDIDEDGDLDLLVAAMGVILPSDAEIGKVIILENDGQQQFTKRVILDKVRRVTDVQGGDLDGDGDIDLAVTQFGYLRGEVQWLENLGNWQFRGHHLMDKSGGIHGPIVDIDNDGDLDIVVLFSQEWESVHAFVNDGTGAFAPTVLHDVADADYSSSGIDVGDIDGDGDMDIAWANGDAFVSVDYRPLPSHGVQWLENRGDLDFIFHRIGDFHGAYAPTIADMDGDGDMDILTVSEFAFWEDPTASSMRWWQQQSDGSFTPHDLASDPTHLVTCDVADLDGNGHIDIVAGGMALYPPFDRITRIVRWSHEKPLRGDREVAGRGVPPAVASKIADAASAGELGMIYHANALPVLAEAAYAEAEAAEADNPRWPYYRGLLDLAVGDSTAALAHLQRAAARGGAYRPLQARLGELYAGAGDIDAASAAFEAAGDLDFAIIGRAELAATAGDWQEVVTLLERRSIPGAAVLLATARGELGGDGSGNFSAVDMGFQVDDPWFDRVQDQCVLADLIVTRAQIAFIRGDIPQAEEILRRAVRIDSHDKDARIALANILMRTGRPNRQTVESALQHLHVALEQDPSYVMARASRGWALFMLKRNDEAAAVWTAILAEEPDHAPSLFNLGQLYSQMGDYEQALSYFRRGVAVPRDTAFSGSFEGGHRGGWMLRYALAAKAADKIDEAIAAFDEAVALNEEDAIAQFEYGNMLIGQQRFEEALPHLLAANELQPNRGPILAAIGYTQFNFGRLEGSKVSLLAAVRIAPRFALAWYHLGNTQRALGDVGGAIESYQMALSLRPDFTLAQEALKTATASDTLSQP